MRFSRGIYPFWPWAPVMNVINANGFRFEISLGIAIPAVALTLLAIVRFGWWHGSLAAVLLLLCLLLHECGHAAAAGLTGTPFSAVGLCIKGAYLRRKQARSAGREIFIAAAGPAVNLLLAYAMWHTGQVANWLALMNLFIAATNLVPLKDTDGARICASWRQLRSPHPTTVASPDSDPAQAS